MEQRSEASAASASASNSGDDSSRPWQSYHTVYTNAKAGMEGVDKEKVQRVVYEMSKGSKYFENEERKEASMKRKIDRIRAQCAKLTPADISHFQKIADKRITELEAMRDLSKTWLHVDMDAFYAAVETLSNPSLKGKPMAVGCMSMISTANYEARRFGVRAAMPGFIACKLCPELILVPPDFKKYTYYSDLTRKVYERYDSNFIATSLDEAYLDITGVSQERGMTGEEVAEELRAKVYEETGLTCSAGVAPNRLLAKVCSDINKPKGQFVLPSDRTAIMTFISSLPIRKIGGIGKVTEQILKNALGITSCELMLQKSSFLCALFSHSSSDFFLSVGLGLGRTDTPQTKLRKSISNERTFSATKDEGFLNQKLAEIAEMLSDDMQKEDLQGRTLTLKLKTACFEVRTRAVTLGKYIYSYEDILKHASKLLKAELPASLRLIGLRISQFHKDKDCTLPNPSQNTLSKFFMPRNASEIIMGEIGPSVSCNRDDLLSSKEIIFSSNSSMQLSDLRGPGKCSKSSNLSDSMLNQETVQAERNLPFNSSTLSSHEIRVSELVQTSSSVLSDKSEVDCLEKSKRLNSLEDEVGPSAIGTEPLFWVDDYMCSLCGAEVPPSFIWERQEHSDFHLAEKLQREELGDNHFSPLSNQRILQKGSGSNQDKQKKKLKRSPSGGKNLPIDTFFVKRNHRS